jgi:hypothetical protein
MPRTPPLSIREEPSVPLVRIVPSASGRRRERFAESEEMPRVIDLLFAGSTSRNLLAFCAKESESEKSRIKNIIRLLAAIGYRKIISGRFEG